MSAIEQGASGAPANLVPKNRRMPSSLFAGGEVIPFQGKTKHLTIDVYHSRGNGTQTPITGMTEYAGLVEVFTEQYLDIYPNRDREISIERMKRSLSHPRTIAMLVRDGDIPVGFGIFPKLLIGGEPVFYSSRALLPDYEEQGAGTYMLERGIQRHQQESHRFIHYGVLMTQNPFSIVTLRKLQRKGVVGKILPYDELYDRREGAEYVNWDAQDFMLGVYREVRIHSRSMSSSTGVSKSELIELGMNEAATNRPLRANTEAWEIYQKMVGPVSEGCLEMNREGGDVDYVTFELKRPGYIQPTVSNPVAA